MLPSGEPRASRPTFRELFPVVSATITEQRLRAPRAWIDCDAENRVKLHEFYRRAYLYAKAAQAFLSLLTALPQEQCTALWNGGEQRHGQARRYPYSPAPTYWFGSYSERHAGFILHTFTQVVQRFERGYHFRQGYRPVQIRCLSTAEHRCRSGVLANASEYGTIRVCPLLLTKTTSVGGAVILHEILHQDLGVRDQRDQVCMRGDESRCYRQGAWWLVAHNKLEKAIRNNDNYALFARAVFLACQGRHTN